MKEYRYEQAWKDIQQFLPPERHFDNHFSPREESWAWKGHRVHLDRFDGPASRLKVVLLHGLGTNGRQMSLVIGGPLWRRGFETVAVDLPGYGLTELAPRRLILYGDWVRLVSDLVDAEVHRDGKPVVLFGLSAGGMLAYHAAAMNGKVAGIVGTTFLDQRERTVRDATSHNWMISRVATPIASVAARTPLKRLRLPMSMVSKMYALVNDSRALKVFLADETSGGNKATVAFLTSYLDYVPAIEPEDFDLCPILLTQPEQDRWTSLALSEIFLHRIHKVRKQVVILQNAGHYPLEQPAQEQLEIAIVGFLERLLLDLDSPKKMA